MRKFTVSLPAGNEFEDIDVEAETFHYVNDTGWLSLQINKKPVAVFAPGKWAYFTVEDK